MYGTVHVNGQEERIYVIENSACLSVGLRTLVRRANSYYCILAKKANLDVCSTFDVMSAHGSVTVRV